MPCYSPLEAWRPDPVTNDKRLIFRYHPARCSSPSPDLYVPCGQCLGCRLERSRQWAVRCMHEASLYDRNCFITLTYDDDNLPADRSLHYSHFQLFMKRLRKAHGDGIRFYMCGEYGEKKGRPHYHACLFNFNFDDLTLWQERRGTKLYRSKSLERLWPYGFSTVGGVTFQSAAYVARYIMKKVTGDRAPDHYTFCRSLHRGDIQPPRGIYADVEKARARFKMGPAFRN